ncbi:MAG: hypothetical protein WAU88_08545 [Candidatus Zixiibacteriota bacterium]
MLRATIFSVFVLITSLSSSSLASEGRKSGFMSSIGVGSGFYFNSNDGREDLGYLWHVGIGYCFGKRNAFMIERQFYIYERRKCLAQWSPLGGSYRHYWLSQQQLFTSVGVYNDSWNQGEVIWTYTVGVGIECIKDVFIGMKWLGNRYENGEWWDADMFALELSYQRSF